MINRISDNDYYDYSKLKMPDAADKMGNGEKFSLDYQRAQNEPEEKDKDKTEEGGSIGADAKRTLLQGGVRLELSGSGQPAAEKKGDKAAHASGAGIADTLRSWAATFVRGLKDFFYKLWNDTSPQAEVVSEEDLEAQRDAFQEEASPEPERLSEEYLALEKLRSPEDAARRQMHREAAKNAEIQKYLHSGNLERVMSLLTENGQKTMAKNSTLLTYYDRTGKIAPLSVSDQERILHGDRNVKKL